MSDSAANPSPILTTQGLSWNLGQQALIKPINFALPAGQACAITGPNGAGKTTLMRMIVGLTPASHGRIGFLGRDITALAAHKRIKLGIAYVFQTSSIFKTLTVFDHIALALWHKTRLRRPALLASDVHASLALVGLADQAQQRADTLNHGNRRLLEIAMALAQKPQLLVLDEPTQGLSEDGIATFITIMRSLAGKNDLS